MNPTSSVSEVLNNTTVTTGNKLNPTVTVVGTKYKLADELFDNLSDLVNPEFRAWYCQRFHALGRDKVLVLASQARNDGLNPRKLFSYLLKKP